MIDVRPSRRMRDLGVVHAGILAEPTRVFDLPAGREETERIVDELFAAIERIGQVHPFAKGKGMGIAAPWIGIARSAAIVLPADDAPVVILLDPRITDHSEETDEQYEGCLSFFDVRGLIPRPPKITVDATALTGETTTTGYERGLARLSHHEIDHPDGLLHTARMLPEVDPIPVEEYRQTGRARAYE
ncbi:formylmethionine deformylase [Streptomyces monashensis]|uniref:Peptide deformylase n=1 Tax=Streptomyces monashensis TaxID=1678012 RepID=A0A1S2QEJ7_9ACTN|nr:formylmethionine deformylase [Streptomyces monashensis]